MISFIIPAHDEEQELAASLSALRIAAGPLQRAYEIIVVDDASCDRTPDIAREHGAHVVAVDCRHIAATRNAGARHASGDVLVFVDADTHVHAPVLAAAMAALGRGAIGGGAAVRLRDTTALAPKALARVFEWVFRVARIAPGCFIFCTRGAFSAAGGFDERYFAGEDVAFSRALARQGRFVILRAPVLTSAQQAAHLQRARARRAGREVPARRSWGPAVAATPAAVVRAAARRHRASVTARARSHPAH